MRKTVVIHTYSEYRTIVDAADEDEIEMIAASLLQGVEAPGASYVEQHYTLEEPIAEDWTAKPDFQTKYDGVLFDVFFAFGIATAIAILISFWN